MSSSDPIDVDMMDDVTRAASPAPTTPGPPAPEPEVVNLDAAVSGDVVMSPSPAPAQNSVKTNENKENAAQDASPLPYTSPDGRLHITLAEGVTLNEEVNLKEKLPAHKSLVCVCFMNPSSLF